MKFGDVVVGDDRAAFAVGDGGVGEKFGGAVEDAGADLDGVGAVAEVDGDMFHRSEFTRLEGVTRTEIAELWKICLTTERNTGRNNVLKIAAKIRRWEGEC